MVFEMIDKNSSIPLYEQVTNVLRQEILNNVYGSSGSIGTHTQLAKRFGVSLITIRKAVQILEEQGILAIQQGKGTFVNLTTLVDPLNSLTGASNMLRDMNVTTTNRVPVMEIRKTPVWLPSDVREILGPECLFILRVVSVGDMPFANTEMYLPVKYANAFTRQDVEQRTVYQLLEDRLGLALGKGRQIIRAAGAAGSAAENLNLPKNYPVLQIERKAYSRDGELIEYMILSYEASRYSFLIELDLNPGTARDYVPELERRSL